MDADEGFVDWEVPSDLVARLDQMTAKFRDDLGLDHLDPTELLDAALACAMKDPAFVAEIARLREAGRD